MQKFVEDAGIEKFRAKQIMDWIYKKGVLSFAEMTNIPKQAREKLAGSVAIGGLGLVKKLDSKLDGTEKYLLRTFDGFLIETVKIHGSKGLTICLSSQIGCPLKCRFCATGGMGFKRDLEASEILEQVLLFKKDPKNDISSLVLMGMGEPLLNYYNVMKAVKLLNSKDGMNFGIRRITLSTCGLPNEIRKLAKEELDLNLSVSLNAPNDSVRNELMPINRKFPIKELMKAIDYYIQNTRRRVTFGVCFDKRSE